MHHHVSLIGMLAALVIISAIAVGPGCAVALMLARRNRGQS